MLPKALKLARELFRFKRTFISAYAPNKVIGRNNLSLIRFMKFSFSS